MLLGLLLLPPLLIVQYAGTRTSVIFGGAAVWAASVAIKHWLARLLSRLVSAMPVESVAALQGTLSAACELGAAAFYFARLPFSSWSNLIAFGLGAGCAEVLYVLILGAMEGLRKPSPDREAAWMAGAEQSLCVRYSVPLERFFALLGHTASRALVYLGVSSPFGGAVPLVLAIVLFAAVDSVSYYGLKAEWNWNCPHLCRRFYGFVGLVTFFETIAFLLLFRLLKPPPFR
jgi:hypothetical protein